MSTSRNAASASKARQAPWWVPWVVATGFALFLLGGDASDLLDAGLARAGSARPVPPGDGPEALRTLLKDGTSFRGALAIRKLIASGMRNDEAVPVVSRELERFTSRPPASYALAKTGVPALPWLLEALKSEKPRVRQQAAVTLGDIGAPAGRAAPALRELAARTPVDESVVAARDALFDVEPAGSRATLRRIWDDVDGEAAFAFLLGLCAVAIAIRNKIRGIRLPDADQVARAPRAFGPCLGLLGLAFLAFALTDLLGARWTTTADTTTLALAAWSFAGALFA